MAFFAEKDVRRLLGGAASPSVGTIEASGLPPLALDLLEAPLQPSVSAPFAVNDPSLDGTEGLLGSGTAASAEPARPTVNPGLVLPKEEGIPNGRADNFAWPASG